MVYLISRGNQKNSNLRSRSKIIGCCIFALVIHCSNSFIPSSPYRSVGKLSPRGKTSLNKWSFGGSKTEVNTEESSEVVAVNIEKTSRNSRRIGGEITVDAPLQDVWAILTDYDNLATHIPNLVESRKVRGYMGDGEQGNGNYKCRLYQKGSQNIIGFEFGADVTMDMVEAIVVEGSDATDALFPPERKIGFKCVQSLFFTTFDGEWQVRSNPNGITTVNYIVDVRPKGPVPILALEWRIKEDVPSNLRALKKAALEVGAEGVRNIRQKQVSAVSRALPSKPTKKRTVNNGITPNQIAGERELVPVSIPEWGDDETMGAYLE